MKNAARQEYKTWQSDNAVAGCDFGKNRAYDGTLNEYKVLAGILRYWRNHTVIQQIDCDDALQEIRLGLIETGEVDVSINGRIKTETSYSNEKFRRCHRGVFSLIKSRHNFENRFAIDDKDNEFEPADPHCVCGYGSVYPELCECSDLSQKEIALVDKLEKLKQTHTVQEICNLLGIKKTRKTEKAFHNAFPNVTGKRGGGKPDRRKTNKLTCSNCGFIQRHHRKPQVAWKCPQCGEKTLKGE